MGIQILHEQEADWSVDWIQRNFLNPTFRPQLYFFETRLRFGDSYLSIWIFVFFWGMGRKDVGPYGVLVFLLCQMPDWGGFQSP